MGGRIIIAMLLTFIVMAGLNLAIKEAKKGEHQKVYYNTGQVTTVGQCTKDGSCSFSYKDANGNIKYNITNASPVSVGQLVYQECWYEIRNGDRCYTDYTPSKN